MFTRILLCTGSFGLSRTIESFCTRNNTLLCANGLYYPLHFGVSELGVYTHFELFAHLCVERGVCPPSPGSDHTRGIRYHFTARPLTEILRQIADQEDARGASTLCLSSPWFARTSDTLTRLMGACRSVYPNAALKVFHTASEQSVELENMLARTLTGHGHLAGYFRWAEGYPTYHELLALFHDEVGAANTHFFINDHSADSGRQAILAFLEAADIPAGTLRAAGADLNGTPEYFPLSPEQRRFIGAVNKVFKGDACRFLAWGLQTGLLAQSEGKRRPFFSSERHLEIAKLFIKDNAALAAALGRGNLFPVPRVEESFQPCLKLPYEEAVTIAACLEPEFAQAIFDLLDAEGEQYLEADARVAWKALAAVLRPRGATSAGAEISVSGPVAPKVAVLTLAHNHASFIERNMQGVLEQRTDFPFVHIIADDASTDETRELIFRYASKHPHIIPMFHKRWSPGQNLRSLFNMADSPYVALCDGDDYFTDPLKLQKQADFLDANPKYSICFHPVNMIWENKRQRDRVFPQEQERPPHGQPYTLTDLVRWNFMSTSSVMYRWRFRNGLPDWFFFQALPGDWYWHMLHAEQGRIGMLPEVMSVYRRHDKGVWCNAETDLAKHKKTHGLQELRTYIEMNRHLKGRFKDILSKTILWEFSLLFEVAVKHDTPELFEQAVKEFPEWATEVLATLKTSQA